MKIITIN